MSRPEHPGPSGREPAGEETARVSRRNPLDPAFDWVCGFCAEPVCLGPACIGQQSLIQVLRDQATPERVADAKDLGRCAGFLAGSLVAYHAAAPAFPGIPLPVKLGILAAANTFICLRLADRFGPPRA
jgi:hypothetical protein